MKNLARLCAISALLVGVSAVAHADTTFTLTNTGGTDGYINGSYPTFQLFGGDNDFGGSTTYTATYSAATTETFDYTYTAHDFDGASWDPAGYVLNGVFTQLSDDNTASGDSTSGSVTLNLNAGDNFGWYVNTVDGFGGRGELDVTDLTNAAPTPEPSSLILLGSGLLGGVGVIRRRMCA